MEHLPPVGWADVATRRDVEVVETRLMAGFRGELSSQLTLQSRAMFLAIVTTVLTMSGLTFGLVIALAR